jgi:hypothetical protein
MLQPRQGIDVKEKAAESAEDYHGKRFLFQPHHSKTILHGGSTEKHTAATSSTHDCTSLLRHGERNEFPASLEAQPTSTKPVRAPNVNSSSLSVRLKVVATVFQ